MYARALLMRVPKGAALLGGVGVGTSLAAASGAEVSANDAVAHPGEYSWSHRGWVSALDMASVRRGFQVYKEVCSACHSLEALAFRNLVGNTHSFDEAKVIASTYDIKDGPDDKGKFFTRPGKLSDYMPGPYANEEEAKAANGGANPPDLSLITKARHNGQNYVFSLLTGFHDAPAGVEGGEGLHYNPYFPGMFIGMARPLYDDQVEFPDGTEASTSQMAKDVVTFLAWIGEPWHDDRKRIGIKALTIFAVLTGLTYYQKRLRWNVLKSRKIIFNGRNGNQSV